MSHWSTNEPAYINNIDGVSDVSVTWNNTAYTYSSNQNPTGDELYIYLDTPTGANSNLQPATVRAGNVVFQVSDPMIGTWVVNFAYISADELSTSATVTNINL